ncbi:putative S-adenosyl-L-methionine-dependent methyltransferases superfamily protein-like [Heracleum sosnowskyi]|uniref:S-adenosyl-L-methionine-dependent methyltransferases superfamily protein-like n=1 Tax=Heracleum sosnowskyi TaxID=360622 RepID=A0AAD8IW54_9APIA|nr:putative S-adenosyl-L-methionine-dependent methyltransferases superfamily protein-like [Heracleum sosnowskyi]
MASASSSSTLCPLQQHQHSLFPKYPSLSHVIRFRPRNHQLPFRIRASSAIALDPVSSITPKDDLKDDLFACPICYEPLIRKGPSGFNLPAIYRSGFKCSKCNKTYTSKNTYLDLTVTAGTKVYSESKPSRTELFRSPLVSFLYERGWRQNFNRAGFPGPDEEFQMAQDFFRPAEGGILVDVSCGSGLFSRKFAKSEVYSKVIALDFSENMLRQSYDFIKDDDTILKSNLALVRADVSRLPFPSGSIDAVHAGAALHCWPSPSNAIAEINRILRSGGVFVGTTFLRFSPSTPSFLRPFGRSLSQNYVNLTAEEIEDLCTSCGLINYSCNIQQSFIMFSAQKA